MQTFDFDPHQNALFLDLDGTVIDIAETPQGVRVSPDLPGVLAAVAARLDGALAVISGRPIADIDRLLDPCRFAAAGVHGAELRFAPCADVQRVVATFPKELAARIARLAEIPGVIVENKAAAVAVHYRNAPDGSGAAIEVALAELMREPDGEGLTLLSGKCVHEVKPARLGKDTALAALMAVAPFAGRRPVVVGDDVTDEAAFRVAPDYGGFGVAVGRMRPFACALLAGPADVRAWLGRIAGTP
jgi:trehalose 6-phosphate phosphatase